MLKLCHVVSCSANLPSRIYRSWQELSSNGVAADCSPQRKSAIQDLQVLARAQQRQFAPHTAHLLSRTYNSWQELSSPRAMVDCSPHRTSTIQDLQVPPRAQQCWSYGRLFPTLEICHLGRAGLGRSSAVLELWQIAPHTENLASRTCRF